MTEQSDVPGRATAGGQPPAVPLPRFGTPPGPVALPPAPVAPASGGAAGPPPPPPIRLTSLPSNASAAQAPLPPAVPPVHHRRPGRRWGVAASLLLVSTLLLVGATIYLWRTSDAWERRADDYAQASTDLGAELADTRAQLTTTTAELAKVQDQLTTAQARIIELANEKAQVGDDREAQRMLADYQERVSEAGGRVALALDQCVQGQNQLIGYLKTPDLYDPAELAGFETDVQDLCQAATDANQSLQAELSR